MTTTRSNMAAPISWAINIGLILIVAATAMPILRIEGDMFKYIYCIGALTVLICRIITKCDSKSFRLRRLYRIETWCGVMFCVAGFFMFYCDDRSMDWIAFTLAGGIIQIYTSIMIPKELAKEQK